MKQNIFGMILFSIIVGTAVYFGSSSVILPTPPTVEERPVFESRNSCRKPNALPKIKVTQAVLNPQTNQLNTSLDIERQYSSNGHFGVTYHFFVKEGAENRYLSSETFAVQPNFSAGNRATHKILSSYAWLDGLTAKNNLYLIVTPTNDGFGENKTIPRFDELNAVPVLLMKGKN